MEPQLNYQLFLCHQVRGAYLCENEAKRKAVESPDQDAGETPLLQSSHPQGLHCH